MLFTISDLETMQKEAERFCKFLAEHNATQEGVFHSRLVFNELVGNVLRHAQAVATVRGEIQNGILEVCVYSTNAFVPPQKTKLVDVMEEHGRGLFLVDSVCVERTLTHDGAICVKIKVID